MKIGIIGSGVVARTLGTKLLELDHQVMISSRNLTEKKETGMGTLSSVNEWVHEMNEKGHDASGDQFEKAAAFGEVIFNCTAGDHSLKALKMAGVDNLKGKILVDVSNPLDFSAGFPPMLSVCNTDSVGETLQREFPEAKVVKTLNTVSNPVMVNPAGVPGDHDMFVAGNDAEAKKWVTDTLLKEWFGWKIVHDLGEISNARGLEMYLPLWVRLFGKLGHPMFNIHIAKPE